MNQAATPGATVKPQAGLAAPVPAPEARLHIGACDLLILGTIAGFVPDAERVRTAFASLGPEAVALGVPPEDLPTLRRLAASEEAHEGLDGPDAATERRLKLLSCFGPTRIPSPDLEAACAAADGAGLRVHAIDLGDADHSYEFTRLVKVRHLVRSSRRERKLLDLEFPEARDAYEVAAAWDAQETRVRPFAQIERLRERHMAERLVELALRQKSLLAVVPATRLPGVVAALREKGFGARPGPHDGGGAPVSAAPGEP